MIVNYFSNISFAQPWFFALFAIIPFLVFWYLRKNNFQNASLILSDISAKELSSWKSTFRPIIFLFRLLEISFIILALARPQIKNQLQQVEGEGVDIVLCMDVSGSMTAQDFLPNRLEAAKNVAINFINKRSTDRIGIVIFAGESFTQCPLTTDHQVLLSAIQNIHNGLLQDGTSIGAGLGTSVDRIRNSKAKSKVIILLTDGVDNGGYIIDPNTAKEIAKRFGIKVYTIGVGTDGYAPVPIATPLGVQMQNEKVDIDEKLLLEIATETGGKYFRAKDNAGLTKIYSDIDALEKSKVEITTTTQYTEKFFVFIIPLLVLLFSEIVLKFAVFKKFP